MQNQQNNYRNGLSVSDISIYIHSFQTEYEKDGKGADIAFDTMTYAPFGDERTVMTKRIDFLSKVLPIDQCGDNISYLTAHNMWRDIEPIYQTWKDTNKLPEIGTPLAAWSGVTVEEAGRLKASGLRTVEDVADASLLILAKTGLPTAERLSLLAQQFVAGIDETKVASELETIRAENEEMKTKMAELIALVGEGGKPLSLIVGSVDYGSHTVAQLHSLLDDKQIDYNSRCSKQELIGLLIGTPTELE